MRPIRALILMLALLLAAPAFAQSAPAPTPAIVSARPDKVGLTLYRSMGSGELDLDWLQGYALVTETRTLHIPAGKSTIRFEGVAGGMLPESVVISGLPDGVREKNLDADLLSPRSLYSRSLGRPVTITHRNANGTMVSERAIIRSGPDGAAVFETRDGFITADCTGNDAIIYDAAPEGLSAKPTLSIEINSSEAREVTLTLSYLAWGFDWQVNYVATMRPDGKSADLTAWITLASGDLTTFDNAETMLIAGAVNRESRDGEDRGRFNTDQSLNFRCMPTPVEQIQSVPAPPSAFPDANYEDAIVVTGSRMRSPALEGASPVTVIDADNIGDYKLYRIPERTTVASNSQKQVQLFVRENVPVEIVYRVRLNRDNMDETEILLRGQNRKRDNLGLPLPRGRLAMFEPFGDTRLLVGEGDMLDVPLDQRIEVVVGETTQVHANFRKVAPKSGWEDRELVVTNANPYPVKFEARIDYRDLKDDDKRVNVRGSGTITYRYGRGNDAFWNVEIPANSSVTLRLRQ